MAYETGTASSPNDLLQKLVTFLTASGWTSDMSQADGAGWRAHLHKDTDYVHLKATTGAVNPWGWSVSPAPGASNAALHIYMSQGFDGGQNWNLQPAVPPLQSGGAVRAGMSMPMAQAGGGYHFFLSEDESHCVLVLEKQLGVFGNLGFGQSLGKAGAWTGGAYFFASLYAHDFASTSTTAAGTQLGVSAPEPFRNSHSPVNAGAKHGYVRVDVDGFANWAGCASTGTTPTTHGYTGKNMASPVRGENSGVSPPTDISEEEIPRAFTAPVFLNQALLLPIRVYVERTAGGYSLLGEAPHIFRTLAVQLGAFPPEGEITIGPDTYVLFPHLAVRKFVAGS